MSNIPLWFWIVLLVPSVYQAWASWRRRSKPITTIAWFVIGYAGVQVIAHLAGAYG